MVTVDGVCVRGSEKCQHVTVVVIVIKLKTLAIAITNTSINT